MAIQLPKIQAEGAPAPAQAPRIQAPALNVEAPMERQQQALEGAGKEIIRYRDQVANHEADNIGTGVDNAYQDWHKKKMYGDPKTGQTGLLYQEGDPKVNFANFNKEAKAKLEELSTAPKDQNWSDLTQNVVNRRLNRRDEELHMEELTNYGHAKYVFDKKLTDANADFAAKRLPLLSAQVQPDHPETFGPLQQGLENLKAPGILHALQYGGAVQPMDADGKPTGPPILTPIVKAQIAKKVSEELFKTVDNLYRSDQGDGVAIKQADAIKQQFADDLDPLHKDALATKNKEAVIKQKGLVLAKSLIHSDDPEAAAKASGQPDAVIDKALQIASEQTSHYENLRKVRANKNYSAVYDHVDAAMNSENPYPGMNAAMHDPVIANAYAYMNPTQKRTIERMITGGPMVSTPKAKVAIMDLLTGGGDHDIRGMDYKDFQQYKVGLNKADGNMADREYKKLNGQTGNDIWKQYKLAGQELMSQGIGLQVYHKVPGSTNLITDDQVDFSNDKKAILDKLDGVHHNMGPGEMGEFITKYFQDKQEGKKFQPPVRQFKGGGKSADAPPAAAPDVSQLSPSANAPQGVSTQAPDMKAPAGPLSDKDATYLWRQLNPYQKQDVLNRYKEGSGDQSENPNVTKVMGYHLANRKKGK